MGIARNGSESRVDDVGEVGSERVRQGNGPGEFEIRCQFALLQQNFLQRGIADGERQLVLDHFEIRLYAERQPFQQPHRNDPEELGAALGHVVEIVRAFYAPVNIAPRLADRHGGFQFLLQERFPGLVEDGSFEIIDASETEPVHDGYGAARGLFVGQDAVLDARRHLAPVPDIPVVAGHVVPEDACRPVRAETPDGVTVEPVPGDTAPDVRLIVPLDFHQIVVEVGAQAQLPLLAHMIGGKAPAGVEHGPVGFLFQFDVSHIGRENPVPPFVVGRLCAGRFLIFPGIVERESGDGLRLRDIRHEAQPDRRVDGLAGLVVRCVPVHCLLERVLDAGKIAAPQERKLVLPPVAARTLIGDEYMHVGLLRVAHVVHEGDLAANVVKIAVVAIQIDAQCVACREGGMQRVG